MAGHTVNVFADVNSNLNMKHPLQTVLYQSDADPTTYYLDEGLTIRLQIHMLGVEGTELAEQEDEEMPEASPEAAQLVHRNECFTRDQTLFLIDLMRQKLEEDGGELPKTLKELNAKVKMGKGSKKQMWKEMAGKLSDHFKVTFDPDKVARKWGTLEEAYKMIKDNNRNTGKGTMRFQFYNEMEELLGGHHDIDYPVVGTAAGLEIPRPELLTEKGQTLVPVSHPHPPIPPSTPSSVRRRRSEDGELLSFMREAEAATHRRHEEIIDQMKASPQSFEAMVTGFLQKRNSQN